MAVEKGGADILQPTTEAERDGYLSNHACEMRHGQHTPIKKNDSWRWRARYEIARCKYENEERYAYVHLRCFDSEKGCGRVRVSGNRRENGGLTHEPGLFTACKPFTRGCHNPQDTPPVYGNLLSRFSHSMQALHTPSQSTGHSLLSMETCCQGLLKHGKPMPTRRENCCPVTL
jgi:hypothetical protein